MRTRGSLVFGLALGGIALTSQPGSAQVSDRELERPPYYAGKKAVAGSAVGISFGCEADPNGECVERDDRRALGRAGTRMRLGVAGPSRGWRRWPSGALAEADVDGALLLTLEVGQYWLKQKGLRGAKVVELGTGHTAELPWLTSLETPVTVLQLTGALVDREGRVVRIGAEGLLARRTAFRLSVIGAQELVTDEDVARLRDASQRTSTTAPAADR